jgi:hypothetical protein
MKSLERSILATLAFYDSFDFPLTLLEIRKFLVHPRRLSSGNFKNPTLGEILATLGDLVAQGLILSADGFYALSGKEKSLALRLSREKTSAQKWKKLVRYAKYFQLVPYLRAVFVSGSMALNNSGSGSDLDVLVVMKSGRIYIGRALLSLVASLMNRRRKRYDKKAPDKFCFNHYLTPDGFKIKHQSIYSAHNYANLVPIFGDNNLIEDFYDQNDWIKKYIWDFKKPDKLQRKVVIESKLFLFLAKTGELLLNNWIGDQIEKILRWYQQRRIKKNPATYEPGGRVIFNDQELEFHPRSFELKLLQYYNDYLKEIIALDIIPEKNSGL